MDKNYNLICLLNKNFLSNWWILRSWPRIQIFRNITSDPDPLKMTRILNHGSNSIRQKQSYFSIKTSTVKEQGYISRCFTSDTFMLSKNCDVLNKTSLVKSCIARTSSSLCWGRFVDKQMVRLKLPPKGDKI